MDENKDDPQAIFESLNDRGIPLSASELLCNYLFKPLIDEKSVDHEQLHNEYWLNSIANIDAGGAFEEYLRLHFSIGEKKVIGKGRRIYVHFKNQNKNLTAKSAKSCLAEIKSGVGIYNQITNPEQNRNENADITNWLIKIKSTGMFSCNPFLLALLTAHANGGIDDAVASSILQETLVLLVRRKMCELSTTKYDSIFPNMLSRIVHEPRPTKAFKEKVLEEGYFVSDQDFEFGLINKPLFRQRDLPFTRLILREIDKSMRSYGQLPDYSTLGTIEHVLPQTLSDKWKAYLGDDCQNTDLQLYTHTLGNLCLLSRPANSHAGQDPFALKKADYPDVSALTVDVKKRDEKWCIAAIKNRGKDLSKKALKIWAWSE